MEFIFTKGNKMKLLYVNSLETCALKIPMYHMNIYKF